LARDRKRAKQRAQRRGPRRAGARGNGREDAPQGNSQLIRADLPGSLEHVGDVDEFDAALIRGAGGVPVSPAEDQPLDDGQTLPDGQLPEDQPLSEEPISASAGALAEPASGSGGNGVTTAPVRPAARPAREGSLPSRALAFLRASWAELQRVQWPNRAQTTQATAVVLGFVAVAGVYFGVADYVAKEIVEAIL